MINIKTNLLPVKKGDINSLVPQMVNEVVERIGKDLTRNLGKTKCENHPTQISEITVSALNKPNKSFDMKFTKWCCEDFKNSIKLEIK